MGNGLRYGGPAGLGRSFPSGAGDGVTVRLAIANDEPRESLARIKEATREFGELFMGRAAEKVANRAKSLLEEAQR